MESSRQAWNDERMDEFAKRTEENFREVRTEMNGRFAALEAKIEQRFNILFGAMATASSAPSSATFSARPLRPATLG